MTVDPLLGGDAALRELLDTAHARGMRVILDGVFNHGGRGFWPFHHVLENGASSPYRDWFYLDPEVLAGERGLNAYPDRGETAPGTSAFGYQAWWGMPALPKLNHSNPAVCEFIYGVAEHWLRFGIDGWRLDVPAEIDDPAFWQEFRRRCRAVNPEAYLVGEIWDEAPEWLLGDRFDALMNYPLGTAIIGFASAGRLDSAIIEQHGTYRRMLAPLDAPAFARRLDHLMSVYDPAITAVQLNLLGSHDAPRLLTLLQRDRDAARVAMLLQLILPGAPCIYYGDEIGMEGGNDPDCRRAFPVDPGAGDRELRAFVQALLAASPRTMSPSAAGRSRSLPTRPRSRCSGRPRVSGRSSSSMPADSLGEHRRGTVRPAWGSFARSSCRAGMRRRPMSRSRPVRHRRSALRWTLPQVGLVFVEEVSPPR